MFLKEIPEVLIKLNLETTEKNNQRWYKVTDGVLYPSVTTVLADQKDDYLKNWIKKVGEQKAEEKKRRGAFRGALVHEALEALIDGKPQSRNPLMLQYFNQIKPVLEENLQLVYAYEQPLYSHTLKLAGRCDLIGKWQNHNCCIDFKTATKKRTKQMVNNYLCQTAAYCAMFEELTGIKVPYMVLLIMIEEENHCQIIYGKKTDYLPRMVKYIKEFYENASSIS